MLLSIQQQQWRSALRLPPSIRGILGSQRCLSTSRTTPENSGTWRPATNTTYRNNTQTDTTRTPRQGAKTGWSNQEEFYRYYLNKKVKDRPLHEWVSSLNRSALLQNLPPPLQSDPIGDSFAWTSDPELVADCLELFISENHAERGSRESLRKSYADAKPGTKASLWWATNCATIDLALHPRFIRAVVHCLVGEQRDAEIWTWNSLDDPTVNAPTSETIFPYQAIWRARVLRFHVESAAYWTTNPRYLDASVDVFVRAVKDRQQTKGRKRSNQFAPNGGASRWICAGIQYGPASIISAPAFSSVMDVLSLGHYFKVEAIPEHHRAMLQLKHPENPDGLPGLRMLRKLDANHETTTCQYSKDFLQPLSSTWASKTFWFIIRTAQTLHRSGLGKEAQEALDIGRKYLPDYFSPGRNPYEHLKPGPSRRTPVFFGRQFMPRDERQKQALDAYRAISSRRPLGHDARSV